MSIVFHQMDQRDTICGDKNRFGPRERGNAVNTKLV